VAESYVDARLERLQYIQLKSIMNLSKREQDKSNRRKQESRANSQSGRYRFLPSIYDRNPQSDHSLRTAAAQQTNSGSNSCGCFLGNLFSSTNSSQPKIQTIEKGHLEEVKFRVLDWEE
jgi:hypothetical protein